MLRMPLPRLHRPTRFCWHCRCIQHSAARNQQANPSRHERPSPVISAIRMPVILFFACTSAYNNFMGTDTAAVVKFLDTPGSPATRIATGLPPSSLGPRRANSLPPSPAAISRNNPAHGRKDPRSSRLRYSASHDSCAPRSPASGRRGPAAAADERRSRPLKPTCRFSLQTLAPRCSAADDTSRLVAPQPLAHVVRDTLAGATAPDRSHRQR